jgi:hypothetical protein
VSRESDDRSKGKMRKLSAQKTSTVTDFVLFLKCEQASAHNYYN